MKQILKHIFFLRVSICFAVILFTAFKPRDPVNSWIRINQLGYLPAAIKVGVWVSKDEEMQAAFQVIELTTGKPVFSGKTGKPFGAYGPFKQCLRLDFSTFKKTGQYFLRCGNASSPSFTIGDNIFDSSADFALRYMRQQRSGFNPFLKDSCHTLDGFTVYGPMPDNTHIDASGGWHDATDYLQYVTTSANATYHLLAAARDFPGAFSDKHLANGLVGANGVNDALDEAKWGLEWLLKMHPRSDWMFNQLADDRDHIAMRLPTKDSVDYGMGKGRGRPVYFATGQPQGLGKYQNRATGLASTAGKLASAFALGSTLFSAGDRKFASLLKERSFSAYQLGIDKPGVAQTAPNRAPYFYEEDNWVDDMELASAALFNITGDKKYQAKAIDYAVQEKTTPWMGTDTANHYQWYPFHNFGHYELATASSNRERELLIGYYKTGIEKVWNKAKKNGFYRGIPFIWCSNNLTVSFAIQCGLYRRMSRDHQFEALEQACIDWLFGTNPWGKCMVYGLPAGGDFPRDPHSSFSQQYDYPLDGALVDGPVYGSIFRSLRGLQLLKADQYAEFQSDFVVYHDDAGDYSTNEPTMDGTASLIYLLAGKEHEALQKKVPDNQRLIFNAQLKKYTLDHGAIVRGDRGTKEISLVFTGDEFADGGQYIDSILLKEKIRASFFFTGNFYRDPSFKPLIITLKTQGHYLGSHSDKHLLYADWNKRDSLLVTKQQFIEDINASYRELKKFGVTKSAASYFLPSYEWYNDSIAAWSREIGLKLINYSPGTRSNADYTWPELGKAYLDSESILSSIEKYETASGLNGFILLLHVGTDPRRKDKFYLKLPELISKLKTQGYRFRRIDDLL